MDNGNKKENERGHNIYLTESEIRVLNIMLQFNIDSNLNHNDQETLQFLIKIKEKINNLNT